MLAKRPLIGCQDPLFAFCNSERDTARLTIHNTAFCRVTGL